MTKKILVTMVLIILILCTSIPICFGFEDELFKFDLPDGYGNISYGGVYVFTDINNNDRGIIIYSQKDTSVKKSVWDIDKSDIDDIVRRNSNTSVKITETDRRAKLGKEKAIKLIIQVEDGGYAEEYILASNKYMYMVMFTAKTQSDLNNSDFQMVKNSFKLKDHTTNYKALEVLFMIAVVGVIGFLKMKKKQQNEYQNFSNVNNQEPIDYKNMTEEDFEKMNK